MTHDGGPLECGLPTVAQGTDGHRRSCRAGGTAAAAAPGRCTRRGHPPARRATAWRAPLPDQQLERLEAGLEAAGCGLGGSSGARLSIGTTSESARPAPGSRSGPRRGRRVAERLDRYYRRLGRPAGCFPSQPVQPVGHVEQAPGDQHPVVALAHRPEQLARFAQPRNQRPVREWLGDAGRERLLGGAGEDAERAGHRDRDWGSRRSAAHRADGRAGDRAGWRSGRWRSGRRSDTGARRG